ncbi:beta-ketoacyl synthase N-terminal-like domain-containing protein, partial [Tahibacter sp.]|uniref:beta-ketoacyl synthase N-terminal-like domain-containing protein n=1 Tax=Tahibacter sp. TaxID=2056211 RepID=UPI0028C44137
MPPACNSVGDGVRDRCNRYGVDPARRRNRPEYRRRRAEPVWCNVTNAAVTRMVIAEVGWRRAARRNQASDASPGQVRFRAVDLPGGDWSWGMTQRIKHEILISVRNPVLRDHQFEAQHLLPGLAYIDILFQTFLPFGFKVADLELRDLAIHRPLIVAPDHDIRLCIEATSRDEVEWSVELTGRLRGAADAEPARRYAVATMVRRRLPVSYDEVLEWDGVSAAAAATLPLSAIYDASTRHGIDYGPFMRADGLVHMTDSAIYVDCRLGATAASDASSLLFHPALMDASMMAATTMLNSADGQQHRAALPLSYDFFSASQALPGAFRVRVNRSLAKKHGELAYLSMDFFDLAGHKIAELGDFATKLLRESRGEFGADAFADEKAGSLSIAAPRGAGAIAGNSLTDLLCELIAAHVKRPVRDVGVADSFYEMGINSTGLLEIARAIEELVGSKQPPTLLFQYSNIDQLVRHLSETGAWRGQAVLPIVPPPVLAVPARLDATAQESSTRRSRRRKRRFGHGDIAVIGLSGRYPQARTVEDLWEKLSAGGDCVTLIPAERWDRERDFDDRKGQPGKSYAKWGGFVSGVDEFDPLFFGLSPREAEYTDPQQR